MSMPNAEVQTRVPWAPESIVPWYYGHGPTMTHNVDGWFPECIQGLLIATRSTSDGGLHDNGGQPCSDNNDHPHYITLLIL